jgi:hypothetical protein
VSEGDRGGKPDAAAAAGDQRDCHDRSLAGDGGREAQALF